MGLAITMLAPASRARLIVASRESNNFGSALNVLSHLRGDKALACDSWTLYRSQCRIGWTLEELAPKTKLVAAEAEAKHIRDEDGLAEVIYHFGSK